jgi:alkyldihydroxyacetonephosphate synthase
VKAELRSLGLEVGERPVHDLWPLQLMRDRAGESRDRVLVVRPDGYAQVVVLVRWAAAEGVHVVPLGGGSGVCGAVAPRRGEIALDLTRLNQVLELDEENLRLHVQAGALGMDVERALNQRGLTLGHHPSSLPVSTIGGLISTRSSGQQSTFHGNIEDMLLGVTAVFSDGTLATPRPGPRSAVGPALHQLLVGAEGGLAVILDAVLGIHRLPARVIGAGRLFDTVEGGLEAMRAIVQAGVRPLVLRLYDPEDTMFQGQSEGGCLLVVAAAGEPEVAEAEAAAIARLAASGRDLGTAPWERWLEHRYALSAERLHEVLEPAGAFADTIEIAAPWTKLPPLYSDIKRALSDRGLALCHFSHAYPQGCCAYFTFAGSAGSEPEARAAYDDCWREAMEAARRGGATISHHHGVGRVRAQWARGEMGNWWHVWQRVRRALDPTSTLNPDATGAREA